MAEAMNYAVKYSRELANAYPYVLHFAALRSTENDNRYQWIDAKTIQIPHLSTTGRKDADRDTISETKRNFSNDWETKTLKFHRDWKTLVHPMHIDETNQVASIANITRTMNETKKFPEMDAYLVSKLYGDWATEGGTEIAVMPTVDNVLELFDTMMLNMDEAMVPAVGRRLYVTPAVSKILKSAEGIARAMLVTNSDGRIARLVANLDDVEIEKVPSELMLTKYNFTVGYAAATDAKQIHMFLAHPSCVITPDKYEFVKLDPPSAGTDGKWVYFEESYGDVFILNNRINGLQFVVGGSDSQLGTLTVTSAAGTNSGDTKLTISPAKTSGNSYKYKVGEVAASVSYGQNVQTWTAWDGTADITAQTGKVVTVVECDSAYKALKAGNATVTAKE